MPNFVERYNAKMREALFHAAIDRELGVKGALRAAGEGRLTRISADEQKILAGMAYGYAAELVRDERERRGSVFKVPDDIAQTARAVAAELCELARLETARLVHQRQRKPKEPVNTGLGVAAAKLMREALALSRDVDAPVKHTPKASDETGKQKGPARPRTLAAVIAAEQKTAASERPQNHGDGGDNDRSEAKATRDDDENAAKDDRGDGAVRPIASVSSLPAGP